MELWIRSQDKMALAKFDLCILEKYDDKYMFIADHYKNMGTYKTKERALEVLDEIQKLLEPKIIYKVDSEKPQQYFKDGNIVVNYDTKTEIQELNRIVYEMPEK